MYGQLHTRPRQIDSTRGRPGAIRRIAPALGLFFLAPLVAEYLLGNIAVDEIGALIVLAPMYGGGAVVIREVARRTGRGWPTIIMLLALAYGWLQAGLLEQSLFNPSYLGQDFLSVTNIPALGMSAYYTLLFTVGHAIWSISVPIAIVEALVPDRRTTPWLGNVGLVVIGVLFLLGDALIFYDHQITERFLASAPQMIGAAAVIVSLVACAFAIGRRPRPRIHRRAPNASLVGTVAFIASSLFFARPESWLGVAIGFALIAVMTVVIARWSRRAGWSAAHRLAVAGGTLLTYAWAGFILVPLMGSTGTVKLIGNAAFALGAIALLVAAARTLPKTRNSDAARNHVRELPSRGRTGRPTRPTSLPRRSD